MTSQQPKARAAFREERCKGCLLCTVVCPKSIITQAGRFNAMGYKVVEIKDEVAAECTGCASCAKICPDCVITVYKTVADSDSKEAEHA